MMVDVWSMVINHGDTDILYCGLLFQPKRMYILRYCLHASSNTLDVHLKISQIYIYESQTRSILREVCRSNFNKMVYNV